MAGPTPVSALIHAATMVTSGVYLMVPAQSGPARRVAVGATLIAWVGAATALFAATIAISQTDIKKVLAYSTVSQLGYMFLAVGNGRYVAAIFHMVTHAFFKALLFLGSGSVIHGMAHEQDMRRYGNLRKYMPITGGTFIVGWLAIAGVPPFSGFWSKDEILRGIRQESQMVLWAIGLVTALLTAFYMSRQVFMVFFGEEKWRIESDTARRARRRNRRIRSRRFGSRPSRQPPHPGSHAARIAVDDDAPVGGARRPGDRWAACSTCRSAGHQVPRAVARAGDRFPRTRRGRSGTCRPGDRCDAQRRGRHRARGDGVLRHQVDAEIELAPCSPRVGTSTRATPGSWVARAGSSSTPLPGSTRRSSTARSTVWRPWSPRQPAVSCEGRRPAGSATTRSESPSGAVVGAGLRRRQDEHLMSVSNFSPARPRSPFNPLLSMILLPLIGAGVIALMPTVARRRSARSP
jgi:hypothetical protein